MFFTSSSVLHSSSFSIRLVTHLHLLKHRYFTAQNRSIVHWTHSNTLLFSPNLFGAVASRFGHNAGMDDDSSPLAQEDDELLANVLALLTDRADPDGTAGQPMGVAHSPPLSHNGHAWVAAGDPLAIIDMFPDRAGPRPASTAIVSPSTETESAGGQTGQAWEGKGRRPRSYDSNKARNERKREIDVLRKEITELSYELTALQRLSIKDKDGVPSSQAIGHPRDAGSGHGAPRLWEAICRHQLERRISSERENSRLKRVLDDQTKMASSMQNLFKKQARSLDAEAANLQATKRVYSLPSDSDEDSTIFTRLLAEADAALFEVDGVFQLNGLSFSREPCRGAHMRDGERGRFVDLYSSSIFPFPLEPTANVVWQFYSGPDKHRGPLYYKTAKVCGTLRILLNCLTI